MSVAGASLAEIAEHVGRTPQGIGRLIKKYHSTGTKEDRARSGRPLILSLYQKIIIYRAARKAHKIKYLNLAKVAVLVDNEGTPLKPPSRSTLYRALKGEDLSNYR